MAVSAAGGLLCPQLQTFNASYFFVNLEIHNCTTRDNTEYTQAFVMCCVVTWSFILHLLIYFKMFAMQKVSKPQSDLNKPKQLNEWIWQNILTVRNIFKIAQ